MRSCLTCKKILATAKKYLFVDDISAALSHFLLGPRNICSGACFNWLLGIFPRKRAWVHPLYGARSAWCANGIMQVPTLSIPHYIALLEQTIAPLVKMIGTPLMAHPLRAYVLSLRWSWRIIMMRASCAVTTNKGTQKELIINFIVCRRESY